MIMNFRSYPSPKSQLCNKIHVLWYVCQNSKNWIWRFIFHSHTYIVFLCVPCPVPFFTLFEFKSLNFFLLPLTIILKLLMWYLLLAIFIFGSKFKNNFGGFFIFVYCFHLTFELNWIFKILISKPRRSCWLGWRMIKLRD